MNKKKPPQTPDPDGIKRNKLINEKLARSVISLPLLDEIKADLKKGKRATSLKTQEVIHEVIIDVNLSYPGGRAKARERIWLLIRQILAGRQKTGSKQGVNAPKSTMSRQYLFARLDSKAIQELIVLDQGEGEKLALVNALAKEKNVSTDKNAIWCIWPDFEVQGQIAQSISTIKADAAIRSFATSGEHIVWAVLDSGIDETHPQFIMHQNLKLPKPLRHLDFTQLSDEGDSLAVFDAKMDQNLDLFPRLGFIGLLEGQQEESEEKETAKQDVFGHGTHVAGIIAGEFVGKIKAKVHCLDEDGEQKTIEKTFERISGMAPKCKLVSMKVLNDKGTGPVSNLVAALATIQEINGYGRWLRIHGINLSVGYDFDPEWFACGQSPLCVEVDRLVKSGVVVVAAAGNTGFGTAFSTARKTDSAGLGMTINDPGNADLAITVGSTHREMPHVYGISYFSSKGPTGDGRNKPDLVAPGEKIISCASDKTPAPPADNGASTAAPAAGTAEPAAAGVNAVPAVPPDTDRYIEMSGTSMAAPHVSGAIAAFLSVRREFIGKPEQVKEIFLATATDLKRNSYFQGHGLVDLMRAIQSV